MDIVSNNNVMDDRSQYIYYAFISYQRKDEKWAKWLQRKLENYKLPVANAKGVSDKKTKYIRPVFRDKTDLTAGPLPDALKEALHQSRYLIVICSPNAVQSPWVNEEIETFIKVGRTEFIIPFIVDGEPYSEDGAKECFPDAIKAIPKEKEPLGVNINENGKERAFIRTVAYMLNVKFDELWNRFERHRRKIRNITIACLAFLVLIVLGVYDYTRTKVEYYADWVDCNGVAQGVVPLIDDQVDHRYYSYKFEYSRVPFGEKGFYSWRLNKVSIVNSKDVISNYTPDNHAFFYPIQEYKYTDGYVTEIINRDTYNRVVMRYTIKDDYDHKVACLVDIEGKKKHQGSAYLNGSTTAFLSDANPNMSKIKRFHYTRNEKGYITKVTYHANDADELDESAIGDNNNIYGKLFDLDEFGRVTKVTYVNHEGKPMTDKYGVGHIRYNNASFEGNDTTEYYGSDNQLAFNEHKFARLVSRLDKYGNPIEQWYEGADEKPCYDYKNIYRQVVSFDDNGCFTEIKYYDFDGNLSYCSENYAVQRVKYDSKGRYIEVSHYDVKDKPCYISGNYSISRIKYNSNDCIIEQSVYDINDKPCVETIMGSHMIRTSYDDYNYLIDVELYNEQKELALSSVCRYSKQISSYDDYHQLTSIKNFDEKGAPCYYTDNTSEHRYGYDNRGNLIKIECYDIDGKPCICKEGYATIIYKYDNYGNRTEERYLGIKGEPVYINMCASVQFDYYPNGLLSEDRYYNDKDSLCLNSEWFAIGRYEYDINGNQIKQCFYDVDTALCTTKDWFYSIMERKYKSGNVIEERFYNKEQQLEENGHGYAIGKYSYDNKHRLTSCRYFSKDSIPCMNDSYIHFDSIVYDNRGLKVKEMYFDKNGRNCNILNGASVTSYKYSDKGLATEIAYDYVLGGPDSKVFNVRLCKYEYNSMGNLIRESYFGENKKPVWNVNDICRKEYTYDIYGNVVSESFYSPSGNLTVHSGWAMIKRTFDNKSRVVEVRYFDDKMQPIGGKYAFPIEKFEYDVDFLKNSFYRSDSILITHVNVYYEKGNIKKLTFTDKNEKLQIMLLQGIVEAPCAMVVNDFNEKGLKTKTAFYDAKGKLLNTEAGCAYRLYKYDDKGQMTALESYDKNGQLSNEHPSNCAILIRDYDIYGNMTEQSFYDKNRNLAKTPWTWSRLLRQWDDRGRLISDKYIMPDGSYSETPLQDDGTVSAYSEKDTELPVEDRMIIILQVEGYGQMYEKGFRGVYTILELNEWTAYDNLDTFQDVLMSSRGRKKHLVLLPIGTNQYGEESVIEYTFSEDPLAARIMDSQYKDGDVRRITLAKYEEWKKTKK